MAYRGAPGVKTIFLHCPQCGKKGVNLRLREDDFWGCRYCLWYCYASGGDTFDVHAREALHAANPAYFEAPETVEEDNGPLVGVCVHCRKLIRRYGPDSSAHGSPWFHVDTESLQCALPIPEATPAPEINLDEANALKALATELGLSLVTGR